MIIGRRINQVAENLFAGPLAARALGSCLPGDGEQARARGFEGPIQLDGGFRGGHGEIIAVHYAEPPPRYGYAAGNPRARFYLINSRTRWLNLWASFLEFSRRLGV